MDKTHGGQSQRNYSIGTIILIEFIGQANSAENIGIAFLVPILKEDIGPLMKIISL